MLKEFGSWAVDLLFFNEKLPKFKDRHVRRAIAHAIDIPLVAKITTFGTAQAGELVLPAEPAVLRQGPDARLQPHRGQGGTGEQSSYPHGFSTSILVPSGNTQYVDAATIIQSELKPLDINVSIQQLDNAAYTAAFEAFNYDTMINFATNDISDPDEMASFQVDYQDGGSHSFWTDYDDPTAIALVRKAETDFNSAKRARALRPDPGDRRPGRALHRPRLPAEHLRLASRASTASPSTRVGRTGWRTSG